MNEHTNTPLSEKMVNYDRLLEENKELRRKLRKRRFCPYCGHKLLPEGPGKGEGPLVCRYVLCKGK